jgi:hypothetical protein
MANNNSTLGRMIKFDTTVWVAVPKAGATVSDFRLPRPNSERTSGASGRGVPSGPPGPYALAGDSE